MPIYIAILYSTVLLYSSMAIPVCRYTCTKTSGILWHIAIKKIMIACTGTGTRVQYMYVLEYTCTGMAILTILLQHPDRTGTRVRTRVWPHCNINVHCVHVDLLEYNIEYSIGSMHACYQYRYTVYSSTGISKWQYIYYCTPVYTCTYS